MYTKMCTLKYFQMKSFIIRFDIYDQSKPFILKNISLLIEPIK